MCQSFSHKDKQVRNDVGTLLSLIALNLTDLSIFEVGVLKTLTLFATFQEGESDLLLLNVA